MSESIFKLVPMMLLKYVAQSSGSPKSKVSESVEDSVDPSEAVGVLGSLCLFACKWFNYSLDQGIPETYKVGPWSFAVSIFFANMANTTIKTKSFTK